MAGPHDSVAASHVTATGTPALITSGRSALHIYAVNYAANIASVFVMDFGGTVQWRAESAGADAGMHQFPGPLYSSVNPTFTISGAGARITVYYVVL